MSNNKGSIPRFLWKNKLYILLIMILSGIIAVCINMKNINYVATGKILLGSGVTENNLVETYENLIPSSTVLNSVIEDLNLTQSVEELASSIKVSKINNTNLLEINVYGKNKDEIINILNEISNTFVITAQQIYPENELYIVDQICNSYSTINTVILVCLVAIFSGILAIIGFIIYHLTDVYLKNYKQIEYITGLRPIISIPNVKYMQKRDYTIKDILEHRNDVFKILMTNLQFLSANNTKSKSILITSPVANDGKSYIANNLAVEFAKAGKKVILIDGDMRRGKLAKVYNLPDNLGFSNYLSSLDANGNTIKERLTRFINDTEIKNLNVITSGNLPPNPIELTKTEKIKEMIKELKIFYDIIIFDGVAILEGSETSILSKVCDLSLIMPSYKKTKKIELLRAYDEINRNDGKVIGIGFNQTPKQKEYKKYVSFKKKIQKSLNKILDKLQIVLYRLKKILNFINNVLKNVGKKFQIGFQKTKELIKKSKNKFSIFSKKIKEFINKKREKILLLEAGEEPIEENQNNIIKEIYENEIKENNVKEDIENKIEEKIEIVKKENSEIQKEKTNIIDFSQKKISKFDDTIENKSFFTQEGLTEEMIKKQVELDDMKRMTEQEESMDNEYSLKKEKERKKQERLEKREKQKQEKLAKKAQKEQEKIEKRIEIEKIRQEKKANKESEKQKQIKEEKIKEEIEEDNLYPKIRI